MDLLSLPLFSERECDHLLDELQRATGDAASVYGREPRGAVDSLVRRTTRLLPSAEAHEFVRGALLNVQDRLSEHFGIALSRFEEPQFLRYQTGDYFVAHQDGNTPVLYDDSRHRRVSAIVFLSAQVTPDKSGDYSGGSLLFHGGYQEPNRRVVADCTRGSLLAFRSELTHEVTPLTSGDRYTIVTWYR